MIIRKSEVDDEQNILNLVKDFASSFKTDELEYKESFKNILNNNDAELLVAEEYDRIVGYCLGFIHYTFYANGKVAWLEEIMVESEYRRKGVGALLVNNFEVFAKNNNCKLVALATRRAEDFYSAIGYEESAIYFRKML